MKKKLLSLVFLLLAIALWAIDCPQDGSQMYWTGETRTGASLRSYISVLRGTAIGSQRTKNSRKIAALLAITGPTAARLTLTTKLSAL